MSSETFTSAPSQTILVIDDDATIASALADLLERRGRHTIVCHDVETAELVLDRVAVTHVLTDVKFTGPFRFEGLDVLDFVKRKVPSARVVLMTGNATRDLTVEARSRGAEAVLQKPFTLEEIERFIPEPPTAFGAGTSTIIPALDQILANPDLLIPSFQPLVWTDNPQQVVGFEALTRLPSIPLLNDPEVLFEYAAVKDQVVDLELVAATQSIRTGRELTSRGFLSINLHPEVFSAADRFCDAITATCADLEVSTQRILFEITEQGPLPDLKAIEAVATLMRKHGFRFAFDDVGSAYSHVRAIALVKPSYLKISQQFGTHCERSATNRKIVENVEALARSFSCEVVLEGIETKATAEYARELGIRFGQGYYYGRPTDVPTLLASFP